MAQSFKTLVLEMIARMGRYHKLLLVLFMVHNFNVAINHTVTSFHTFKPSFYCKANNDSKCAGPCPGGYEFQGPGTSVVTEFSLVCERRVLPTLLNMLYFLGVTLGAVVCGAGADIYGRKIIVISCLYIQGVLGLCFYFIHNLILLMITRAVQGFFVQGLQGCTYALMVEHCNPKLRTLAGIAWQSTWSLGLIYLAGTSYCIPDWHDLHLVLAIPTFVTLIWIWLIPESLTWLIIKNRLQEAYNLSMKVAKWNKDQKFLDEIKTLPPIESSTSSEESNVEPITFFDIMGNPILRRHTYVLTTMWFSIALSYYSILYYLPKLPGDRHLNFAIGAIIEMASCIVAYFIFAHWGRRIPMAAYQYVIAVFCFTIMIIDSVAGDDDELPDHWSRLPIVILALVGKALAIASFAGMTIFGGECYPTGCRAAAMGICGFFARLGCIISPQIHLISEYTFSAFPVLIVGIFITITGTSTLILPETLGTRLPDTMDDVFRLWGK